MTSTPTLSVIVPFHNVEIYLDECLASLAGGSLTDFEVIMVDDGSTDASAEIADRFSRADHRFTLLRQPHRGCGLARNTGARVARGEHIAFADSDDLVPPAAYKLLVGSLEETGSDIACGGVQRFNSSGSWDSALHAGVFSDTRKRTHIGRSPELINDRTIWNKVFRREFWTGRRLAFPDQLYEDAPVTIPAHYFARHVDLLSDTVYMWRRRDGGDRSISQRSLEFCNVRDRLKQVLAVNRFLAANCTELKDIYDRSALEHDLTIVLLALPYLTDGEQSEIIATIRGYLDRVDQKVIDAVHTVHWRQCALTRQDYLDGLLAEVADTRVEDLL